MSTGCGLGRGLGGPSRTVRSRNAGASLTRPPCRRSSLGEVGRPARALHAAPATLRIGVAALGRLGVHGESHFDGHLIVRDLAALDVAAGFEDFEPADVVDGGRGAGDRRLDRILDAGRRGADELDDLVNMIGHGPAPSVLLRGENG